MFADYASNDAVPTLFYSPFASCSRPEEVRGKVGEDGAIEAIERRGLVALRNWDLESARTLFRDALERRQRASGAAHGGLPQAFGRLGVVAFRGGELGEAQTMFELGLELARVLRARLTAADAALLHNLGAVAYRRGQYAEAEEFLTSALAIKTQALGWSHPSVAVSLSSQGYALLRQGRAEEALTHLERSRLIHERVSGDVSACLGRVLCGIGAAHLRLGQDVEAEGAFIAAAQLYESLLGSSAKIARCRFSIACARWRRNPIASRILALQAIEQYSRSRRPDLRKLESMHRWLARHSLQAD